MVASKVLSNSRAPGESREDFVKRRRTANSAVRRHLKGRTVHESLKLEPEFDDNGRVVHVKAESRTYVKPKLEKLKLEP